MSPNAMQNMQGGMENRQEFDSSRPGRQLPIGNSLIGQTLQMDDASPRNEHRCDSDFNSAKAVGKATSSILDTILKAGHFCACVCVFFSTRDGFTFFQLHHHKNLQQFLPIINLAMFSGGTVANWVAFFCVISLVFRGSCLLRLDFPVVFYSRLSSF